MAKAVLTAFTTVKKGIPICVTLTFCRLKFFAFFF
jgi:hypothetical protein